MISILTNPLVSWILAIIVFISPFLLKLKKRYWTPEELSELATSFGILGTFLGIVFGLVGFNLQEADKSIETLLNGLKTAFYTSIAGMIAGSIIKIFPSFYGIKKNEEEDTDGLNDISKMVLLLGEIVKNQKELSGKENEQLKNIEKALCGDGDSTVLTQIQKVRITMVESNADMKKQIEKISDSINNGLENVSKDIKSIEKSLCGDGESTVLTQIQKVRISMVESNFEMTKQVEKIGESFNSGFINISKDILDFSNRIVDEFRKFEETMAENNTKALAESLAKVLDDFNNRINEHLSDNFKRLNEAVQNLIVWQDQNRKEMEQINKQFEISLAGIKECENSLISIRTNAESYNETAKSLESVIYILKTETELMLEQIKTFGGVADKAREMFPIIEKNVNNLVSDFSSQVVKVSDESNIYLKSQMDALNKNSIKTMEMQLDFNSKLNSMILEIGDHTKTIVKDVGDDMKSSSKNFNEFLKMSLLTIGQSIEKHNETIKNQQNSISEMQRALNNQISEMFSKFRTQIEGLNDSNAKTLAKQVEALDKGLQDELIKSLNLLGSQLSSLSYKFVEDYKPLTEKLRDLILLAEKIKKEKE